MSEWKAFEDCTRKQLLTTCYALEDMRDRALKRAERAEASLGTVDALRLTAMERAESAEAEVQDLLKGLEQAYDDAGNAHDALDRVREVKRRLGNLADMTTGHTHSAYGAAHDYLEEALKDPGAASPS